MQLVFDSQEAWLDYRKNGLGASDTPVALGLSPYMSPLELWARKRGIVENDGGSEAMFWGNTLEAAIIDGFQKLNPQYEVERVGKKVVVVDDADDFLFCSPDAFVMFEGQRGTLQAKNVSAYKASEWKDGAPLHYQAQAQHEMAVCGYDFTLLVALIGGNFLDVKPIQRNDSFISFLREKAAGFWDCVRTGVEPSAAWQSRIDIEAWQKLHPDGNGACVELPPEAALWHEELQQLKAQAEAVATAEQDLKNKIKMCIGDASFGEIPGVGKYAFKQVNKQPYQVAAQSYRMLRFSKAKTKGV